MSTCICPENGRVADCPIKRHRQQYDELGWPSGVCLRWQDVRWSTTGEPRLVFSCECNGDGCPFDPRTHPTPARRGVRHNEGTTT